MICCTTRCMCVSPLHSINVADHTKQSEEEEEEVEEEQSVFLPPPDYGDSSRKPSTHSPQNTV